MGMIELAKGNIFLPLDWIYSSVNLATVNLSGFSHSSLTLPIKFLEIFSFLEFLLACLDHVVHVLQLAFEFHFVHSFV